jgi:hypothetical protein
MPNAIAAVFQELVRAYEAEVSIESRLAHDADKIETLLQAREYEAQGRHDTAQWQDSSTAALRTDAAKELADAILATTPTTWWSAFGRSYTELPKQTRGTRDARSRTPETPGATQRRRGCRWALNPSGPGRRDAPSRRSLQAKAVVRSDGPARQRERRAA